MKFFSLICIFLNSVIINCQNLRNLKLTMDPQKLKNLSNIANDTLYQIFGLQMDFQGRGISAIESTNSKIEIALYGDQEIPTEEKQFRVDVKDWVPTLPDLSKNYTQLKIFGKIYDLKEQFKILSHLISNSIKNGFVIYYQKSGDEVVANTRFKCFVNSDDGEKAGSFEIAVEDKNDKKTILDSVKNFLKNIKKEDVEWFLMIIAKASSVVLGLRNDWIPVKTSSSFFNFPNLSLLIISVLLLK